MSGGERTDQAGAEWLAAWHPSPHTPLPSTHVEVGEGASFTFERRPTTWDPEATLADFLDDHHA